LLGKQIKTMHNGKLEWVGMSACGSAVGHDCRIGAGFVIYPGRTIESGTILVYKGDRAVIDYNIDAESSAHDDRVIRMYDSPFVSEDIVTTGGRADGAGGGSGPGSRTGAGLDWGDMTAPADRARAAHALPDERGNTAAWTPLQGPAAPNLSEA
jgi:hypothetical protein